MPTEKDLDLALAAELEANPLFLDWLVAQTKFGDRGAVFHACRANHPWGSHPFPITDASTGESIIARRQSETDVLLIVSDRDGRLLGLHIENKLGAGQFTELQPEMYAHRAAHWIGDPRYGGYSDFETILIAPEVFRSRNAAQAATFGCFISHEAIGDYIPSFRPTADAG